MIYRSCNGIMGGGPYVGYDEGYDSFVALQGLGFSLFPKP